MSRTTNPQTPDLSRCCVDEQAIADRLRAMRRRILERRESLGWTQKDLGDRAGYWATYVGQIERGERMPPLDTLLSLAQALGVDVLDLLADETTGSDGDASAPTGGSALAALPGSA